MAEETCYCGAALDMPVVTLDGKERRLSECRKCFIANLSPMTRAEVERLIGLVASIEAELQDRSARVLYLEGLISSPEVNDFMAALPLEAAHQVERWGVNHDAGKLPADWVFLVGHLLGKAFAAPSPEKQKHHVITAAAVCLNLHRHITGENTSFRPGIEPPKEVDRA